MKTLKTFCLFILGLGVTVSFPKRAAADGDDPPGRAARLAYTNGSVSFQPAGTDDWVAALGNRPMTTGDKLWTDRDSRAELNIGSAAIRLGGQTGFSFLNLTDDMAQIQLSEGSLGIHVRHLNQNEGIEIDTPNLAFNLLRPGDYRLEVNQAGDSTAVSVRAGEGEVTGGGQAFTIHANQHATFTGSDQLSSDVDTLGGYDDFDRWGHDRDLREEHAVSARYVSRDVIGYQDLDDYGDWRTVPDYGGVWFPRSVESGWSPYRDGHWAWVSPWGWTWVDDAPWGFAPFHYGRWAYVGNRWGWCPGPVAVARPVYAPALVAWIGGEHFGVSIGIGGGGGVGWFPLGPREVYVPPYRVSRAYVNNVNVTNTTVNNTYVTNVYNSTINNSPSNIKYVNRTVPNAVTATSQTAFASGQAVRRNIVQVDQKQLAQAPVVTRAAVVPQQRSVVGSAAAARVRPPAAVQTRAVVAKTAPPPPPVSFTAQQKAIQANGGRPLGTQEVRRLQPQTTPAAAPAQVRVVKAAAKPVPVENVARNKVAQPGPAVKPGQQPNKPAPNAQPAPARPGQPMPQPQQQQPPRTDRPTSTQPNSTQPPHTPGENRPQSPNQTEPRRSPSENRPNNASPNRPDRPPAAQPNKAEPPNSSREQQQPSSPQPSKVQPRNPSENRPTSTSLSRSDRPPSAQPNKAEPPNSSREERQPSSPPQPNKVEPPRTPSQNHPTNTSPNRSDRPPSAQSNKAEPPHSSREQQQPSSQQPSKAQPHNPSENRPTSTSPNRSDRPPSAQPNKAEPSRPPTQNRSTNTSPNRPDLPPRDNRDAELERKHQQDHQPIQQQQNQPRQQLDQKHEQQRQKTPPRSQPAEDNRPDR
jgi:hypothetical protein